MYYTTTRCPNCGYMTRNREPSVPKVDLWQTITCCPMCKTLIVDPINTEYEFMTESERGKFSSEGYSVSSAIRSAISFILGFVMILVGIMSGSEGVIVGGVIVGVILIIMGIFRFVAIGKVDSQNICEQLIYESLLRTSNKNYVDLLKKAYGEERIYSPLPNRSEVIKEYQKYSTEEVHTKCEKEFFKLLDVIDKNKGELNVKKAKSSSNFVNGGVLVSAVASIPSAIAGAKQKKELKKQHNAGNANKNVNSDGQQKQIFNKEKLQISDTNKLKLLELKELLNDGLITEEEYNDKRKHIIEDL